MSLKKYRDRRQFAETPEPEGKIAQATGPLRFVVQLHRATRLHYDFRLELEGTLKSWAVPKGPSLNPSDRRFAVMVEDHPFDYRTFEGIIPKGNYGAGTVMVWDEGTYHSRQFEDRIKSQQVLLQGLRNGHLTFLLYGKKLKGEFALVKLKKSEENGWLLLKKGDEFATDRDVTEFDRSVVSNRTLEEIAREAPGRSEIWLIPRGLDLDLSTAPRSPMPRGIKPMLAETVERPFDRDGWVFEMKWDGYRAIAEVDAQQVKLYSRRRLPLEGRFPPIVAALRSLPHQAVLDGEVVVVDEQGEPRFHLLQSYPKGGVGRLVYYVFDLLHLNGHDLRKLPLSERKRLLQQIMPSSAHVQCSDHIEGKGVAFFQLVSGRGLEGIIAKDAASTYQEGHRSLSWLKIKTVLTQQAVIGGFTRPQGGRKNFGSLLLGVYEKGDLTYIGHAGSGFSEKALHDLHGRLAQLRQQQCPFIRTPKTNAPVQWVKPLLVCEVSYREWTKGGLLRHPTFLGIRENQKASAVRRLQPARKEPARARARKSVEPAAQPRTTPMVTAKSAGEIVIDERQLRLTNLDKVYWPQEGYRKRDLIRFYREVAPLILPHLKDRPQSLNRHPNGIQGQSFYQKDVEHPPEWVKTVRIHSGSGRKDINFLVCQDEATLVYLANLGCIELNPWSSRIGILDQPDYLVLDLDPEEVSFDKVVEAALAIRNILEQAGAQCYCKTSGKTGLHVYLPLGARYTYEQARQFSEIIARLINRQLPNTTSIARSPSRRRQRVYLDFLQNRRGQTLACAYSVRPHPGATVSTPLKWQEVKPGLDPAQFTIHSVRKRLDRVGDLWQPVLDAGVDLIHCLERLGAT